MKVLDRTRDSKVRPNAVSFTTLIRSFCELRRMEDATMMLDRTRDSKVRSTDVTFKILIRGFASRSGRTMR